MGPEEIVVGIKGDLQRLVWSIKEIVTPNRVFGVPEQIIAAAFVTNLVLKAPSPSSVLEKASDLGIGNVLCAVLAITLGIASGLLSPQQWHSLVRVIASGVELLAAIVRSPAQVTSSVSNEIQKHGDRGMSRTQPQSSPTSDAPADSRVDKGKERADVESSTGREDAKPRRSLTDEEKAAYMQRRLKEKRELMLRAAAEKTGVGPSFARPDDDDVKVQTAEGIGTIQSKSNAALSRDITSDHQSERSGHSSGHGEVQITARVKDKASKEGSTVEAHSSAQSAGDGRTRDALSVLRSPETPEERAKRKKDELKRYMLTKAAACDTKTTTKLVDDQDLESRRKRKEEALRLYMIAKSAKTGSKADDKGSGAKLTGQIDNGEAQRKLKELKNDKLAEPVPAKASQQTSFSDSANRANQGEVTAANSTAPTIEPPTSNPSPVDRNNPMTTDSKSSEALRAADDDTDGRHQGKEEAYRQYRVAKAAREERGVESPTDSSGRTATSSRTKGSETRSKRNAELLLAEQAGNTSKTFNNDIDPPEGAKVLSRDEGRLHASSDKQPASSTRAEAMRRYLMTKALAESQSGQSTHLDGRHSTPPIATLEVRTMPTGTAEDKNKQATRPKSDREVATSSQSAARGPIKTDKLTAQEMNARHADQQSKSTIESIEPSHDLMLGNANETMKRPVDAYASQAESELPYQRDQQAYGDDTFADVEDLKAKQRVKALAMKQYMLQQEQSQSTTPSSLPAGMTHDAKPLKSALKKTSVTFAGIPDIPTNQAPNYFLTKCWPARPALVPFPHGLHPKPGKPPGTLWFNNIPDDASELMAPTIRPRKKSAA